MPGRALALPPGLTRVRPRSGAEQRAEVDVGGFGGREFEQLRRLETEDAREQ